MARNRSKVKLNWKKKMHGNYRAINKKEPVKLFETETTSIVIVNLTDCMLQNLPGLVGVFWIHHHSVFKSLYLEIPLLLVTHRNYNLFLPIPKIAETPNPSLGHRIGIGNL